MKKVREFHKAGGLAIDEKYSKELMDFRLKLIFEEVKELAEAALDADGNWFNPKILPRTYREEQRVLMENLLKEMCDLVYVIKGMAVTFGLDFDQAYDLVHESNMTKVPFRKNKEGKIIKGKNYKKPELEGCVP